MSTWLGYVAPIFGENSDTGNSNNGHTKNRGYPKCTPDQTENRKIVWK
jgi:hypothetical protein